MKRFLKSTIVDIAKQRNALSSIALDRWLLSMLKIGFNPPKSAARYPKGASAACVISIDFDRLTKSENSTQTRWYPKVREGALELNARGTRDLLSASEKYSIPMTWAVCGETAEADPESYQRILRSPQKQEIGVHTYSHIDVSACTKEELEEDVARCLNVLKLKESPKTFIFPWNRQGNFETLKELGFETYRDPLRSVGAPYENHGLVDLPPTYYVDLKSFGATSLMKKYLELCIAWNSVYHLWLHPWSVVFENTKDGEFTSQTLDPLFSFMKEKRDEGVLSICSMGELSTFYRQASMGQSVRS